MDALRARIGMLFQQPVIFPKSILANVIFGTRHLGKVPRKLWLEIAERSLREAALWDEVKDRLNESALRLSVGQQQRLCLARTLAVDPEVILMDEPTSALRSRPRSRIQLADARWGNLFQARNQRLRPRCLEFSFAIRIRLWFR